MKSPIPISGLQLALRAGLAGRLATWAAIALGMVHPIYAFIGAVIVTDLSPALSQRLGLRRVFATVIGSVCGAALSQLMGPGPATVGAGVVGARLVGYLLGAGMGRGSQAISAGSSCWTIRPSRGFTPPSALPKRFLASP